MPWKYSEDVEPGDYVRDVGSVIFAAPPDQHGEIELVVTQPGSRGHQQPARLGVGGVVEVEPPYPGT